MRDDFPIPIKKILASRVAYLCSNPECKKPTLGPGSVKDKTIIIGIAAHITAASYGGKRFDISLTPQQRSDSDNGIWLCGNCAKLIDSDENLYTVELLKTWRKDSENNAKQNISTNIPVDPKKIEYDFVNKYSRLKNTTQLLILENISKSYFSLKYNPSQYVQREIEITIEDWLFEAIGKKNSLCYLILAPAGSGKTNLFCSMATSSAKHRPTFLLSGPHLQLDNPLGLWSHLTEVVVDRTDLGTDRRTALNYFKELTSASNSIVVFIDAINEHHDPIKMKRELSTFLEETKVAGISVIISCRDYYWGLFDAEWWNPLLKTGKKANELNKYKLGNYTPEETKLAFKIYFSAYSVSARPEGNALEQFRHPLLLRFFCETYSGEKPGILKDIRLKNLFDDYWTRKLDSIAERMIAQGEFGIHSEISIKIGFSILGIAHFMLEQNSRIIPSKEAIQLTKSTNGLSHIKEQYGRILDEHLILEEFTEKGYQKETMVSFVFEEFMEYAMARSIITKWQEYNVNEISHDVEKLTKKYNEFNQVFGVILYAALMLKEQRGLGLWHSLIQLGEHWERVVIEAFRKLPSDQIDDGVFHAIIELLNVSNQKTQIDALELLKFGRLKRIATPELIEAVGRLVTHRDLPIRRRAINALSIFPSSVSIIFIEKAVTKSMILTERYVVVGNAAKVLSGIDTDESAVLAAKIQAWYWHSHYDVHIGEIDVQRFIGLLNHSDPLIRFGAIQIIGTSGSINAIPFLEKALVTAPIQMQPYTKGDFPKWVDNEILYSNSTQWGLVKKDGGVERYFINRALESLRTNILEIANKDSLKIEIQAAFDNRDFKKIEQNINSFNYIYDRDLIVKIIKFGLEHRSGKKWRVTGNYKAFKITAPRVRLKDGLMTKVDIGELSSMLNLQIKDEDGRLTYKQTGYMYKDGCIIGNAHGDHDYWKEYIYRSWGEIPKVYGRTDEWTD